MAISRTTTQITWGTFQYISLIGNVEISDVYTIPDNCISLAISVAVRDQTGGFPSAGDNVDFYLAFSNQDVEGIDIADTYDDPSSRHLFNVGRVDVYENNLYGNTAASNSALVQLTIPDVPIAARSFKVIAKSNAVTNSLNVFARVTAVTSA